jgi:Sulfotransferase family
LNDPKTKPADADPPYAGANERAPILVTGVPRSGTSWIGRMLDAGGDVVYINEPLNDQHPPGRSPGVLDASVDHRFEYISDANESRYLQAFHDTLALRYGVGAELRQNRSPRDLLRMAKYLNSFLRGRLRGRRPLLDDPFAVFSVEWFARRLGCQVVVAVRHPAAVASSRKLLGWRTDFRNLLDQPRLLDDWLHPFERDMEEALRRPEDAIGQSCLLWRMAYHVVAQLRSGRLLVVRNEDLSLDPAEEYARLYRTLELPFRDRARRIIERSSTRGRGDAPHTWSLSGWSLSKTGFRRLDSRANVAKWKTHLSAEEVSRIRSLTEDVASCYYPDADWELDRASLRAPLEPSTTPSPK